MKLISHCHKGDEKIICNFMFVFQVLVQRFEVNSRFRYCFSAFR